MKALEVYQNNILAGVLVEHVPGRDYQFTYEESYVKLHPLQPISVTLPVSPEPYISETLFSFFSNMLPEGDRRRFLCMNNHIDEHDMFSLLCLFAGEDIVGSVSLEMRL